MRYPELNLCETMRAAKTSLNSEENLQEFRVQLAASDALNVVNGLIQLECRDGMNEEEAVDKVMQRLECLADIDRASAIYLMVRLWPMAAKRLMHDVCDAIDLWIVDSNPDPGLVLKNLPATSEFDAVREHFQKLLNSLKS